MKLMTQRNLPKKRKCNLYAVVIKISFFKYFNYSAILNITIA